MNATKTHTVERHVERLRRELATGVVQVRAMARSGGAGLDDALFVVEGLLDEFVKLAAVAPLPDTAPRDPEPAEPPVADVDRRSERDAGPEAPEADGADDEAESAPGSEDGLAAVIASVVEDLPEVVTLDSVDVSVSDIPASDEPPAVVQPVGDLVPVESVAGSGPASLTIDADFRLVQASEAFLQLFDARPGAFAASCYELLGRVEPCEPCAGGLAHASAGPVTRDVTVDGRIFRVAARPIPLPDGQGVVETFDDVTDEVRRETAAAATAGRADLEAPSLGPDGGPAAIAPPARSIWPWVAIALVSLGTAAVTLLVTSSRDSVPSGAHVVSDVPLEELLTGNAPLPVLNSADGGVVDLGPPPGTAPNAVDLGKAVRSSVGGDGASVDLPAGKDVPFRDKVADAVARQLVAQGDYAGAALAWEEMIAAELPNRWTIGLETNCLTTSLASTLRRFGGDPAVICKPVTLGSRDCYLVVYGSFPTKESAEAAIEFLPPPYRDDPSGLLVRTFRRLP